MAFGQSIFVQFGVKSLLEEIKDRCTPNFRHRCRVAVVGRSGTGKSTLINKLLGKQVASVGDYEPVTKKVESYDLGLGASQFRLIDTPGIGDNDREESLDSLRSEVEQLDSVLFVSRLTEPRVSGDERRAIQLVSEKLGKKVWERSLIVFTCSDFLESSQYAIALQKRTELLRQEIANYAGAAIADNISSVSVNNKNETIIFFAGHSFDKTEQPTKEFNNSLETGTSKLLESLAAKDAQTRLEAALALGEIGDEEAVPALSNILETDPNPEVRRSAAEALGMIGSKETEAKK